MAMAQPVDVRIEMVGVDRATVPIKNATNAMRGLTNQMGRSQGYFVRNRRAFQQIGFQVSDFAIQLGGGQNALLAFTQQGGQLLQFFGPFGAVLAGVVAVFGSMALAMGGVSKTMERLTPLTGVLRDEFAFLGTVMTQVKEFAIDMANVVVNNLDRVLIIAATFATFFAVKWVAAFAAARITTFSLVGALLTLRNVFLRFLPTAILVALGELAYRFVKLAEYAGGYGRALGLLGDVFREVFDRMRVTASVTGEVIRDSWMLIVADFKSAVATMYSVWGKFLGTLSAGMLKIPGMKNIGMDLAFSAGMVGQSVSEMTKDAQDLRNTFELLMQSGVLTIQDLWNQPIGALEKIKELMGKDTQIDVRDLFKTMEKGSDGASKSVDKLSEKMKEITSAVKGGIDGMIDSIVDGGKSAIEVLRDMGKELLKIALRFQVYETLGKLFPSMFGASGTIPLVESANGNVFSGGRLQKFASGGVVGGPTLFGMNGGTGLMGEAGPEAILPLSRGRGGRLGVDASGVGGAVVNIQVINNTGAEVRREKQRGSDGRQIERIIIGSVGQGVTRGELDGAFAGRFGQTPTKKVR